MEDRITDLETKICFHEQTLEELNQLIIEQQQQIDRLTLQLKKIAEVTDEDEGIVDISLEVPPPHY